MPVSNKPSKHSERNKPWRGNERRSARVLKVQMTRHLIVCEGTQTEPLYFEGLKEHLGEANGRKVDICICGSGEHTLGLFERAQDLCRKSPNLYDHVWLVYDKDYFPAEEFDCVESSCAGIQGLSSFHALWSNPCFEVWFLLHFRYSTAELTTAECLQKTKAAWAREYGVPYEKNDKRSFSRLLPLLPRAKDNAERLHAFHESMGDEKPSMQCPDTMVPALFAELEPYLM